MYRAAIHKEVCLARLWFLLDGSIKQKWVCFFVWSDAHKRSARVVFPWKKLKHLFFSNLVFFYFFPCLFSCHLQVLHEPLIDEDPVFIATCTERELRKRKKRKFSLWVRQCSSTGFICQVSFASSNVVIQFQQALKCIAGPRITVTSLRYPAGGYNLNAGGLWLLRIRDPTDRDDKFLILCLLYDLTESFYLIMSIWLPALS